MRQFPQKKVLVLLLAAALAGGHSPDRKAALHGPLPPDTAVSLEEGFRNPPVSARPKAFWDWLNGNFSLSQITYELEEAKAKGMGGFDIWDVGTHVNPDHLVPDGPAFMGEESVGAIGHAIREATRLKLEMGLIVSSSWNAGGSWVKPEHGAMGLFRSSVAVNGPLAFDGVIPFPTLPETYDGNLKMLIERDAKTGRPTFFREVAVLAVPVRPDSTLADSSRVIDLSSKLDRDGKITWQAPAGPWRITRYVCAPTGQPLMIPSPNSNGRMIDHFSAEATETHLNYFIEKLAKELGPFRQTALKYLYTDSYEVNSAIWTPQFPEEFRRRNGYSLVPYLPVLDGFTVVNRDLSQRFRFDYQKTLSDLIIENHYAKGKQVCNRHGLRFAAEAGGPGPPVHNCPFESLKSLGALDVPRGEFWHKQENSDALQIVKGIASASHLYNQKYVEAESFTSLWLWQEGPGELKPTADRAFCEGLNRIVYHTFPHVPQEAGTPGWVYNFGTLINTTQSWWPKSAAFHQYLSRCSFLLQQGNFVGDVLYYYGDQAPNFVPAKHIDPSLGFGYDYDVTNSDVILNRLTVRNQQLTLPHGQRYAVLVLPQQAAMSLEVLRKLEELVRKGATVVGPRPTTAHGLQNWQPREKEIRALAAKMWGQCDGKTVKENAYGAGKIVWGKPLRTVLRERGLGPDFQLLDSAKHADVDFIHRKTPQADIYFVRNRTDRPLDVDARFRVKNQSPEWWNPDDGSVVRQVVYAADEQGTRLPLRLPAYGSGFVVFRPAKPSGSIAAVGKEGRRIFPALLAAGTPAPDRPWSVWQVRGQSGLLIGENGNYQLTAKDGAQRLVTANLPARVELRGTWEIRFPHGKGAPGRVSVSQLNSWTTFEEEGARHFSGVASYHHAFEMDEPLDPQRRVLLDLGRVKEIADVYLNGRHLGIRWHAPFAYDVTEAIRPGRNQLVVEVANVLSNQMTGDAKLPEPYRRTRSNITKGPNAWMHPWPEVPLVESGLLGPVTLRFAQFVPVE